jgi:hypothetical protein
MTSQPRHSKSEEAVMAGDGGRVPDVSDQRAVWEVERDRFGVMFSGPLEVGEYIRVVAVRDPASVLAALLAESPEATVAAIEALLTSDEAVVAVSALRRSRFENAEPMAPWAVEVEAACRSLLSKAPKGDGVSDEGGNQ